MSSEIRSLLNLIFKMCIYGITICLLGIFVRPLLNPNIPSEIIFTVFGSIATWLAVGARID
jgi:hypothetical protein